MKQEDLKFEPSLCYKPKSCLKVQKIFIDRKSLEKCYMIHLIQYLAKWLNKNERVIYLSFEIILCHREIYMAIYMKKGLVDFIGHHLISELNLDRYCFQIWVAMPSM